MRTAKTVSITLPPELLTKAQEFADREHRTMSELFREALRRYIGPTPALPDAEWQAMLKDIRAQAKAIGVTTEADVERLVHEHRQSKRA